jgi:hypothetical protein
MPSPGGAEIARKEHDSMRCTIAEGLRAMRGLQDANAGRLRGVSLRYGHLDRSRLAATPQPWRDQLWESMFGTITPDTPEYLVFSDGMVVAVLTIRARITLPDYPLSTLQLRHRSAAVAALSDLHRYALSYLADLRAVADGRIEVFRRQH